MRPTIALFLLLAVALIWFGCLWRIKKLNKIKKLLPELIQISGALDEFQWRTTYVGAKSLRAVKYHFEWQNVIFTSCSATQNFMPDRYVGSLGSPPPRLHVGDKVSVYIDRRNPNVSFLEKPNYNMIKFELIFLKLIALILPLSWSALLAWLLRS